MDNFFEYAKWIAMTLSVIGNYYVNHKNILGLYLWFVGSGFWIFYYSIHKFELCQLILFLVYTYLNIDGIIKWKKDIIKN